MVSAGLDTVPATLVQGLAYLATPHGQQLQDVAHTALLETYGSPAEAWDAVIREEKVAFLSALVKETLRFYTVIAMSLPRTSIKSIRYQGATIPVGTIFYMNARAANFDESRFSDPHTFNPERYLEDKPVWFQDFFDFRPVRAKVLVSLTMPMVQDLACAPACILRIGSCTWHWHV
jgi:phenylacetate 2-hydroxylase